MKECTGACTVYVLMVCVLFACVMTLPVSHALRRYVTRKSHSLRVFGAFVAFSVPSVFLMTLAIASPALLLEDEFDYRFYFTTPNTTNVTRNTSSYPSSAPVSVNVSRVTGAANATLSNTTRPPTVTVAPNVTTVNGTRVTVAGGLSCDDVNGVPRDFLAACGVFQWTVIGVTGLNSSMRCCTTEDPGRCGVELPPYVRVLPSALSKRNSSELAECCPKLSDRRVPQAFGAFTIASLAGVGVKLAINTATFVFKAYVTGAAEPRAAMWVRSLFAPGKVILYWSVLSFAVGFVVAFINSIRAEPGTLWGWYNAMASALLGGSPVKSVFGLMSMCMTTFFFYMDQSHHGTDTFPVPGADDEENEDPEEVPEAFGVGDDGEATEMTPLAATPPHEVAAPVVVDDAAVTKLPAAGAAILRSVTSRLDEELRVAFRVMFFEYYALSADEKRDLFLATFNIDAAAAERRVAEYEQWRDAAGRLIAKAANGSSATYRKHLVAIVPPYELIAHNPYKLRIAICALADVGLSTGISWLKMHCEDPEGFWRDARPDPEDVGDDERATEDFILESWVEGLPCDVKSTTAAGDSAAQYLDSTAAASPIAASSPKSTSDHEEVVRPLTRFALEPEAAPGRLLLFDTVSRSASSAGGVKVGEKSDGVMAWYAHTPMPCHMELQPRSGWCGTDRDIDPDTPMVLVASARAQWQPLTATVAFDEHGDVSCDAHIATQGCEVTLARCGAHADGTPIVTIAIGDRFLRIAPDATTGDLALTASATPPSSSNDASFRFRVIPADGSHRTRSISVDTLSAILDARKDRSASDRAWLASPPMIRYPGAVHPALRPVSDAELIRRQRAYVTRKDPAMMDAPVTRRKATFGALPRDQRIALVANRGEMSNEDAAKLVDAHARRLVAFLGRALEPRALLGDVRRAHERLEAMEDILNLPPHCILRGPLQFHFALHAIGAAEYPDNFLFDGLLPEPAAHRALPVAGVVERVPLKEKARRYMQRPTSNPDARFWFMYRDPVNCPTYEAATAYIAAEVPPWRRMSTEEKLAWLQEHDAELPELRDATYVKKALACIRYGELHGHEAAVALVDNSPGADELHGFCEKTMKLTRAELLLFCWGHTKFAELPSDNEDATEAWRAAQPARLHDLRSSALRVIAIGVLVLCPFLFIHVVFGLVMYGIHTYGAATMALYVIVYASLFSQIVQSHFGGRVKQVLQKVGDFMLILVVDLTLHMFLRMPAEALLVAFGAADMPYQSGFAGETGQAAVVGVFHAPFHYLQMASPTCLAATAHANAHETFTTMLSMLA